MSKIIKNQYLGVAKIDSLKIRIPLKSLISYDKSLEYHYVKVCEETGEITKSFKHESKSYDINGVPLTAGIAKQVRCGHGYEDYLYILINAKQCCAKSVLKAYYFIGVNEVTVYTVYRFLIESNIIEIEWSDFLHYSLPTDIDIAMDYRLPMDEYREMLNGCAKMTKPSSNRDKGYTPFNAKTNKGIAWSTRETSKYLTNPYLKIYHKGLELEYHSRDFYDAHLSSEYSLSDIKNTFRIETSIKNKKHLTSLNKSIGLDMKHYNLKELFNAVSQNNQEVSKLIVQKAVNAHLLPRKKSLTMFKNKNNMTPADCIMFSSLLGFIEDCGWTYLQVEKLLLSRIENESSKSLNRKKLKGFYQDITQTKDYKIKAKNVELIFDSWGWF